MRNLIGRTKLDFYTAGYLFRFILCIILDFILTCKKYEKLLTCLKHMMVIVRVFACVKEKISYMVLFVKEKYDRYTLSYT